MPWPRRPAKRRDEDRPRLAARLAGIGRHREEARGEAAALRTRDLRGVVGRTRAADRHIGGWHRVRLRGRRHRATRGTSALPARHPDPRCESGATRFLDGNEFARGLALNDVVVARGKPVRSIRVAVKVDGEPLIVYWADGLIIATATGSTAYGFSVGGPLILPASSTITMVPIAPHLSFGNAIVFDPQQVLELEVRDEPAVLSFDGQEEHDLKSGDVIAVRKAETVARFARTAHARPFVELLRQKILKEPG